MNKVLDYQYIKRIIADRLAATPETCSVETEVEVRESGKSLGRANIAVFEYSFAPKITSKITIIQVKIVGTEIRTAEFGKIKVLGSYAHQIFLCLPKSQCSLAIATLCEQNKVGLLAVNVNEIDGPIGMLSKRVKSPINHQPKKWADLYSRLEKRGLQMDMIV